LCSRGLEEHLPIMCDFWETVLSRAGVYRRNALHAHRRIHRETPLAAPHFARWLALWTTSIDHMYRGPVAEHAKIQAARIATAMHRRLTGTHAPQLAPPVNGQRYRGAKMPARQRDHHRDTR
jgi:hemoglobin